MRERGILLVEDNEGDEMLALLALRNCEAASPVAVVRDGLEALDYLHGAGAHAGRDLDIMPKLILMDLKLPKMDGLEVLERIRADERTRFLRVIIWSSSKEARDIEAGYRLGANGYLWKPVDFAALQDALKAACRYWLQFNEPVR